MQSIWKRFMGMRFRNKMVVYYIVMTIVPFAIFSLISSGIFYTHARSTSATHTTQLTGQVSDSIDVYIAGLDKMADTLSMYVQRDIEARQLLGSDISQYNIDYMLQDAAAAHPEIAGILVANADSILYTTGMTRVSTDTFDGEEWYKKAVESGGRMVLISSASGRNIATKKDYSTDEVFSLCKAIYSPTGGGLVGVILFDIKHDIIRDSINRVSIGGDGFVFVINDEGNVVYTDTNNIVYRVNPVWLQQGGSPFNLSIMGQQYQLMNVRSEYTGWQTVGVFSLQDVMGGTMAMGISVLVGIIATVALVLLLSVKLANYVTRPISKLQKLMGQAEQGDLAVRFNTQFNDEIGQLGNTFNHMIEQIDVLIGQVYIEQQDRREAEIKILQEQIKPHFLYNTLDSISWMARDYGAMDIVKIVDALTNMFRIGLSRGRDFVRIEEEVTHVSNYLYIQKIRYREKLEYTVHADDGILHFRVPKLILQPLVENAIYHGIKQKRGVGHIDVRVQPAQGGRRIVFTVEDDGAGMDERKLAEVRALLAGAENGDNSSFGLFYIKNRMVLRYKDGYSISVRSGINKGTAITLSIPMDDTEGAQDD